MKRSIVVTLALCSLLLVPRMSHAKGLGADAGFSLNPDQFIFGLHTNIAASPRVSVVPSLDVGFGDDVFTIAVLGDVRYSFSPASKLRPYLGGGIEWINYDPSADNVDSSSKFGGNILGGVWLTGTEAHGIFLEGHVGLGDVPDFTARVGLGL